MTLLSPCPGTPNCVSSLATNERQYVDPFAVRGTVSDTIDRLAKILRNQSRCDVQSHSATYVHAVCKTPILRFRDDVEFMADMGVNPPVVHVRSASRLGYSDLGTNRARVEHLRSCLEKSYADKGSDVHTV